MKDGGTLSGASWALVGIAQSPSQLSGVGQHPMCLKTMHFGLLQIRIYLIALTP
jgi:hypothetical protein